MSGRALICVQLWTQEPKNPVPGMLNFFFNPHFIVKEDFRSGLKSLLLKPVAAAEQRSLWLHMWGEPTGLFGKPAKFIM